MSHNSRCSDTADNLWFAMFHRNRSVVVLTVNHCKRYEFTAFRHYHTPRQSHRLGVIVAVADA